MMAIGYCHFSAIKRWGKSSRFDGRTIVTVRGWNLAIDDHVAQTHTCPAVYLHTFNSMINFILSSI